MDIHAVPLKDRKIQSYHDHSKEKDRERIVRAIEAGASVAYASEAGMPLIADPGFALARAVQAADHTVTIAPGASAALAGLALSGLPTDAFFFGGFLPNTQAARRKKLENLKDIPGTLIFFEAPKRVAACLSDMVLMLGGNRDAALARELTKKFETVIKAPLDSLLQTVKSAPPKGEIVLIVGQGSSKIVHPDQIDNDLKAAMASHSLRDAVDLVAASMGATRKTIYKRALELAKEKGDDDAG